MSANESYSLPDSLTKQVADAVADWTKGDKVRRLWQRDASLWTNTDEAKWLGWLGVTEEKTGRLRDFRQPAADVKSAGFTHVLLLGMGGSSLCPEVLKMTFGKLTAFPELHVLDSTDPAQVKSFENRIDLSRTL